MSEKKDVKKPSKPHLALDEKNAELFNLLHQRLGFSTKKETLEVIFSRILELTELTTELTQPVSNFLNTENERITKVNREKLTKELTEKLTTELTEVNHKLTDDLTKDNQKLTQVNQGLTDELTQVKSELNEVNQKLNLEVNKQMGQTCNLRKTFGRFDFLLLKWVAQRESQNLKCTENLTPEEMLHLMFRRYLDNQVYLFDRPNGKVYKVLEERAGEVPESLKVLTKKYKRDV